jgi:hypothetical protein
MTRKTMAWTLSLGAIFVLPLVAFGALERPAIETEAADRYGSEVLVDLPATCNEQSADEFDGALAATDDYKCCWVFYSGMWWCVPC